MAKAQYAIDALLYGLGITPTWVEKDGLSQGGIYYGEEPGEDADQVFSIRLRPDTLVFFSERRGLRNDEMAFIEWDGEGWPVPFGSDANDPPDIIAATFFWLSGWQEYSTVERDEHGRFPYSASLQSKLGIPLKPLVDVYRLWLGSQLKRLGIPVQKRMWNEKTWSVAMTHDVDFAETRKRSRLKSIARGEVIHAFANLGKRNPRRASLNRLKAAEVARKITATYFFKGGASSPEDVDYDLKKPWLRDFLEGLIASGFEVGLHPSYAAYDHPTRLGAEYSALASVVGSCRNSVRTHFLRWVQPTTPRLLSQEGFHVDSSLGFSQHEGFRRATCHPFRLFDISANQPLDLWELPLAVMDTTLFGHRSLSVEDAISQIQAVFDSVKRVGGCAVVLWHNTTHDKKALPGQGLVFENSLDSAMVEGACIGSLNDVMQHYSAPSAAGR